MRANAKRRQARMEMKRGTVEQLAQAWRALMAAILIALSASAAAQTVPDRTRPSNDPTVLVVTEPATGRRVELGSTELDQMTRSMIRTKTPWINQVANFEGVLMRDLLAAAKIDGKAIRARALNDYMVEIPIEDLTKYDVILATRLNGRPMSVREKGPYWIMYPFDAHAELRTDRYYERAIWQVKFMEVR